MLNKIISVFICLLLAVCLFGCENIKIGVISSDSSSSLPSAAGAEPSIYTVGNISAIYLGADGKMWGYSVKNERQDLTKQQLSLLPAEIMEAIDNLKYDGRYVQPVLFSDSTLDFYWNSSFYGIDSNGGLFKITDENVSSDEESFSLNREYLADDALEFCSAMVAELALLKNGDILVLSGREIDGTVAYTALNGEELSVLHADAVAIGDGWYLDSRGDLYVMAYNNGHGTRGNGEFDVDTAMEFSTKYIGDIRAYVSPDGYKFYSYAKVMSGVKKAYGNGLMNMFAIKDDDSLWAWGENDLGLVGDGGDGDGDVSTRCVTATPVKILDNVKEIALVNYTNPDPVIYPLYGGFDVAFALTYSGELYGWGNNTCGAVGNGDYSENNTTNVAEEHDVLIVNRPEVIMEGVKSIYGKFCAFALTEDDNLYSWGYSYLGNTGTGLRAPDYDSGVLVPPAAMNSDYFVHKPTFVLGNVAAVFVRTTVYAVEKSGKLYGWGVNPFGLNIEGVKNSYLEIFAEPCIHPSMKARIDEQGISFEPVR